MTDAGANVEPTAPKAGIWEDFVDIFVQPAQVFERRRDGKFGLALLALVVITGVLFFALRNGIAIKCAKTRMKGLSPLSIALGTAPIRLRK